MAEDGVSHFTMAQWLQPMDQRLVSMEACMWRTVSLTGATDQVLPVIGKGLSVLVLAPFLCILTTILSHMPGVASQPGGKKGPPVDQYGDPLPKGALARLGTVRFHHPGYIGSMVFSPDGKTLATVGDGLVCLWSCACGKELPRLPAAHVGTVAFSADGRILATASDREKVRLWDIAKAKEIDALQVRRQTSMVYRSALAFSEGGKLLVYAGGDGVAQGRASCN
jgi:hypothetical protein